MPSSGQKLDSQSVAVKQTEHTARPVDPELVAVALADDVEDVPDVDDVDVAEDEGVACPGHEATEKPPDSGTQTRSSQAKLRSQSATVLQVFAQSSVGLLEQAAASASSAPRARCLANMRGI